MSALRRVALVLASSALLAGLLASCGGNDSSSAEEADSITKAEFVEQATEICKARGAEIKRQGAKVLEGADGQSQKAMARTLSIDIAMPALEREIREIEELGAPSGDEEKVETVLSEIQEVVNRLKKDPAAIAKYPYRHSENVAAVYGIPACGRP